MLAGHALFLQMASKIISCNPHVGENHHTALFPVPISPEITGEIVNALLFIRRPSNDLLDAFARATFVIRVVTDREVCRPLLAQNLRAKIPDLLRNGGTEQQGLASTVWSRQVPSHQDICNHDFKPLFQHLVSLVKDHRLHIGKRKLRCVQELNQTARRCTNDVSWLILDSLRGLLDGFTTINTQQRQLCPSLQYLHLFTGLDGKLSRR
mmetsp:Transcript_58911/g.104714  ORF Transcript_58911/g.104714 Transcript_58911/m.104714 type:complete len:209 (+) Transcript_58911:427-1053(+)